MKFAAIVFVFIAHLLILSQLTFTAWPEMLSYPFLFSQGFAFYKDFIIPYPPALILVLAAVFNTFGFLPEVLKTFTWILILVTDLLIYIILQKVSSSYLIALIFLVIFIFLQSFFEGNMLWFDFATVLPLIASFYFTVCWLESKKITNLFLAGIFLSLSILIKQITIVYLLVLVIFYPMITRKINVKDIGIFLLGIIIICAPLLVYIISQNSFYEFLQWTIWYPLTQWQEFPGYVNFDIPKKEMLMLGFLFSPIMLIVVFRKNLLSDKMLVLNLLFLIAGFITVYPRFSFFHLQPAIAFLVIILARIFLLIPEKIKLAFLFIVFIAVFLNTSHLYQYVKGDYIRFYTGEEKKLGQIISREVTTGDKVYLLGIHSLGYVLANRLPPHRWSDNFGWYLEIPGVQSWVVEGFEKERPAKVFWREPNAGKWYELGVYQPQQITDYIRSNYQKTSKIEGGIQIWTRKN